MLVPLTRGTLTPAKMSDRILPLVRGRAAEGGRGSISRTLCAKPIGVLMDGTRFTKPYGKNQLTEVLLYVLKQS